MILGRQPNLLGPTGAGSKLASRRVVAAGAEVQASSGQVVRHRLNRGGDRQLNRALHTIVMLRQTHHGPTRADTSRRIAQGQEPARGPLLPHWGTIAVAARGSRAVASR
jgi:Transposase IS116/IS110/IS902 family